MNKGGSNRHPAVREGQGAFDDRIRARDQGLQAVFSDFDDMKYPRARLGQR